MPQPRRVPQHPQFQLAAAAAAAAADAQRCSRDRDAEASGADGVEGKGGGELVGCDQAEPSMLVASVGAEAPPQ